MRRPGPGKVQYTHQDTLPDVSFETPHPHHQPKLDKSWQDLVTGKKFSLIFVGYSLLATDQLCLAMLWMFPSKHESSSVVIGILGVLKPTYA